MRRFWNDDTLILLIFMDAHQEKIITPFVPLICWFGRHFLRWNRLSSIDLAELGSPIEDLYLLYDAPFEVKDDENFPEAQLYGFDAGPFHEVFATCWKGNVHQLVYWSEYAAPTPDLLHIAEYYGKGIGWDDLETGYIYYRKDGIIRLWCSVAPAIGVGTIEYFETQSESRNQSDPLE